MTQRWSRNLRVRLVALVLLPLIPVFVVALVNARQNRDDASRDARRNAESLGRLAAAQVDQRLEAARQFLLVLSGDRALISPSPAACRRELRRRLRAVGTYENLAVVDTRGRLVCTAVAPGRTGTSLRDATWWRRAMATGTLALGDDLGGALAPRAALVVAQPAPAASGGREVIAAVLDLRDFGPVASAIDLPAGGTLTVFQRSGLVLARFPDPRHYIGRDLGAAELVAVGRRSPNGSHEAAGLDGHRRIYGLARAGAGAGRVVVAVGLSKARAQAAADRTLHRTLVTLLVVALFAVGLALAAANWLIARPVRAMAGASRRIAAGDLTIRSGVQGGGEVGELAAAFDEMAATLEAREREIDRSAGERQRLLAELVAAEEEERKRIAEDIHDDTIQALSALLLRLELIESRMPEGESRDSLTEAREAARDAVARLRHLVFKLTPPSLATTGLGAAVETLLAEVSRVWGVAGTVRGRLEAEPSADLRALLYRITAEAVNNAAKHSGAAAISVELANRDDGVWVLVRDDGVGFEVDGQRSGPGHLGLVSMRERAESAGGWWRVTSHLGEGTSVEFWVPLGGGPRPPAVPTPVAGETA